MLPKGEQALSDRLVLVLVMTTTMNENDCLLAPVARERIRESRLKRISQLSQQIETAETQPRKRLEHLESVAAETALPERRAVPKKIMKLAVVLVGEGVREFANGLLVSQRRLGVHAALQREYAADLANEIRGALDTKFQSDTVVPWAQNPIAQQAMQTCEEVIEARRKDGDCWPYGRPSSTGHPTWAPIVQEWEGYKAINKIESGERQRIPESVLRALLASHYGIGAKDVDREQIRQAGTELCCHYGPILMVPLALETTRSETAAVYPRGDARFLEKREDEFRNYRPPGNSTLSGEWFSLDGSWTFHGGPGSAASSLSAEQIFKALSRQASNGLTGSQSAEPCWDWLEALRCATNTATGERLYSKVSATGSYVLGEGRLERIKRSGEQVPPGGLIEFFIGEEPEGGRSTKRGIALVARAEMRMVWETYSETVADLFASSANFCLELRSRVPDSETRETMAGTEKKSFSGNTLNRFRLECGWSFDEMEKATGVNRKLIMGHVNKGKGAYPGTWAAYASAFSEKLGRTVTVAELKADIPSSPIPENLWAAR